MEDITPAGRIPKTGLLCEADCEEHEGEVRTYHVRSKITDWGRFAYCTKAADEDIRRGLSVEFLDI